jgi:hypothetical protein
VFVSRENEAATGGHFGHLEACRHFTRVKEEMCCESTWSKGMTTAKKSGGAQILQIIDSGPTNVGDRSGDGPRPGISQGLFHAFLVQR